MTDHTASLPRCPCGSTWTVARGMCDTCYRRWRYRNEPTIREGQRSRMRRYNGRPDVKVRRADYRQRVKEMNPTAANAPSA